MFSNNRNPLMSKEQFGFFETLVGLLPSVITTTGTIVSSKIQTSAAKDIAKSQAQTQLASMAVQERIAQLQLQALQTPIAAPVSSGVAPGISALTAGIIPETVLGVPVIYLILGGVGIFLLWGGFSGSSRRRRRG